MTEKRLTRKQRRQEQQQGGRNEENTPKLNFILKDIQPLTENQRKTFEAYDNNKNILLHGIAGTGKSFIANYLAIRQILEGEGKYKKIVIIRSTVAVRDLGFLPGNAKEKAKVYEAPYYAIFSELFGRGDAYEYLKNKNIIEFISTSFIRGITLNDCIIIVDEIANLTGHELDSVITRVGKNCKVLMCGDFRQSDFTFERDKNGFMDFMRILQKMKSFEFIDFQRDDIVRSQLVRDYIITKDSLNITL